MVLPLQWIAEQGEGWVEALSDQVWNVLASRLFEGGSQLWDREAFTLLRI